MDKLENVMKGLGCCSQGAKEPYTQTIRYCAECPYLKSKIPCTRALARDALELLKAQEPKFVSDIAEAIIGCKPKVKVGHCPSCGVLMSETDRYCRKCGQAVKWDD